MYSTVYVLYTTVQHCRVNYTKVQYNIVIGSACAVQYMYCIVQNSTSEYSKLKYSDGVHMYSTVECSDGVHMCPVAPLSLSPPLSSQHNEQDSFL